MTPTAVILAAGKGIRMKSDLPKVLHPLWGKPMIHYPIENAERLGADPVIVVIGYRANEVIRHVGRNGRVFVRQTPQLGTGHALIRVKQRVRRFTSPVLVMLGDAPLISLNTLKRLIRAHRSSKAVLTILSAEVGNPSGYGRILRDSLGRVAGIAEELDASDQQRAIREINSGVFMFDPAFLNEALSGLTAENRKGEYYLTDVVRAAFDRGLPVDAIKPEDPREILGINSRRDLMEAHEVMREFKVRELIESGVHVADPKTVYVEPGVEVGTESLLAPNIHLQGTTRIGRRCRVGTGAVLIDSVLADDVLIKPYCVIEQSRIGHGAQVGPFARLRPESALDADVRVGNFVEIKKSRLGRGTKAQHLSYLGDAVIGSNVNVGAGTITCNYDGRNKWPTHLADGVFVGSDTQFVAPVRVGKGAYIGAGSTITQDVPAAALAVSRAEQRNIAGWARRRKKRRSIGGGPAEP